MPYTAKGKCVYKKDTGEKVGCTNGSMKKYLAALHANVPDAKNESQTTERELDMKPIKLSEIAKKIVEGQTKITLNGKEVDPKSIEIDGVDHKDYPDFSDAYISAASYMDGTPVDDNDLQKLEDENYGLTNDLAHGHLFQEGYDWRDDPKLARDFEKSDVSQDEFERHQGLAKQRPAVMAFKGITFFNVPAGQDQLAYEVGLRKLKSGKWGHKHPKSGDTSSGKEILKRAEQEFGKGRYWEPTN